MSAATYDRSIGSGGAQWSVSVTTTQRADADRGVRYAITCSPATNGALGSPTAAAALSAAVRRFLSQESPSEEQAARVRGGGHWAIAGRLDAVGMDGLHRLRVQARTRPMTTFRVTIDGRAYEVTVEEVPGEGGASGVVRPPKTGKAAAPAGGGSRAGERAIRAPMPGKVLAVTVGQAAMVDTDTVLVVLEAMKMENDILAPGEGTVKAVHVRAGDTVNTGDVMMVIE